MLIASGCLFFGLFLYDLLFQFKNTVYFRIGIASCALALLVFVSTTAWAAQTVLANHIPVFLTLLILLFGKIVQLIIVQLSYVSERRQEQKIGFATTGIVVVTANRQEPQFVLVLNKNLRSGKGLWVPPGGHFSPYFESPAVRLRQKVRAELGIDCQILNPYGPTELRNYDSLKTDGGEWIAPPIFILREDLGGRCSHFHEIHIDFIYLCESDGSRVETNPKYMRDHIKIPLSRCCSNFQETENVISDYIEAWYIDTHGHRPGSRDDLTKDLVWRIYLSAKIYNESRRQTQP